MKIEIMGSCPGSSAWAKFINVYLNQLNGKVLNTWAFTGRDDDVNVTGSW